LTICFAALSFLNLRWAMLLIVAALPTYLIRFSIGPVPTTLLELMLFVAIVVWIFHYKGLSIRGSSFLNGWRTPITLLLIAATLGVIISPDTLPALGVWKAYFIEPILFFLMVNHIFRKEGDEIRIINWLGVSSLAISLFALFQYFSRLGIPAPWDIEGRVTSFYPFPNAVGLFIGPMIVLAVAMLARAIKLKYIYSSVFWGITTLLGTVSIILSQTEAAWIAVAVSLFVLSLFYKKIRLITIPLAVVSMVVIFLIPSSQSFVTEKIFLQDWSGQVRLGLWQETTELVYNNPIIGVGLSGFPIAIQPYHKIDYVEVFQYPHNFILNIWVELGLLGLIGFFFVIKKVVQYIYNSIKNQKDKWLTLAFGAVFLEMLIHGLVDVPYFKNDLAILTWILIALITIVSTRGSQQISTVIYEEEIIIYD